MTTMQSAYRALLLRTLLPVSAFVALLLAALLASLFLVARDQTRTAQGVEARLALDAIRGRAEGMERFAIDYASWGEVAAHLEDRLEASWARENIGARTLQTFDLDGVVIVAPDGATLYAAGRYEERAERAGTYLGGGFQTLLDRARASPAGVASSMAISADGQPALAAAAPVRPPGSASFGAVPPVLVFVERIDQGLLFSISRAFLLSGLRLVDGPPAEGHDWAALAAGDGSTLGYLDWSGARPGDALLRVALPVWAVLAVGFALLVGVILRQATSGARLLGESERRARHDALTGLPNRVLLFERLDAASRILATGRATLAVVCIDLDGFKAVNDTFGHAAGDTVLRETARRLAAELRPGETVARLGGDEFACLLPGVSAPEEMAARGTALIRALAVPVDLGQERIARVSATLGVALAPRDGVDPLLLLRDADDALYRGKRTGKGRVLFHERPGDLRRAG